MQKKKISILENSLMFLVAITLTGLFLAFANGDLKILIPLGFGIPAFLIALTSLLFNRARAWPAGAIQRRSLYAAEILVRAIVKTMLSILSALVITYFIPLNAYNKINVYEVGDPFIYMSRLYPGLYLYIIPCLFLFSAFVGASQCFRLILYKRIYVSGGKGIKQLFRSMR